MYLTMSLIARIFAKLNTTTKPSSSIKNKQKPRVQYLALWTIFENWKTGKGLWHFPKAAHRNRRAELNTTNH